MTDSRLVASKEVEAFLKAIPKTETHLHVEGALPYELLVELDDTRFPADPEFRRPEFRYGDFVEFDTLLIAHAVEWFTSAERYHVACTKMFQRLAEQNVKYVETSFHLHMSEFIKVDGPEILAAIKSAVPHGMEVKVIGGLVRDGYTPFMKPIIDALHQWEELDGIDLHGREWLTLEDWAPGVWKKCRDAGKIIKVHAGEFGGPEKIYEALDQLGSKRIQHGVRAREDAELVKRLADEGVVLDVCPLSNEKLGVFGSLEEHPLRELSDAGVICTVNTDDPLCFGYDLVDEYRALSTRLGYGIEELAHFAKNGFEHAALDPTLKRRYIAEIDEAVSQ